MLGQRRAQELGCAFADLGRIVIDELALGSIPAETARQLRVIPVKRQDEFLWVAMELPFGTKLLRLGEATGLRVKAVLVESAELTEALGRHYPRGRVADS